ncbi:MAG: hypothetical protein QXL94_01250 [Candidatus Parvarchaeum sp.]
MKNKKSLVDSVTKSKYSSALEELCNFSTEETSKKVFGDQYYSILDEISYILKKGYKEVLDYSYLLNTAEMKDVTTDYMKSLFQKGLKKVGYFDFDVDFNDEKQVKTGIYGYTVAHVYKIIKDGSKNTK